MKVGVEAELHYQQVLGLAQGGRLESLEQVGGRASVIAAGRQMRNATAMLGIAAIRRDIPLIKALLALGVAADGITDIDATPLGLAVSYGRVEETVLLLSHVSAARPSKALDDALCAAALRADLEMVSLLLDAGAQAQVVFALGDGPLRTLPGRVIRRLIAAGARPSPFLADIARLDTDESPPQK